jgi:branched-chain amino acid transport system ATP-binding protein
MAAQALLEIVGVSKRFGRVTIADDLSFTAGARDAIGIVGPNGAGKTSLFGIISGELAQDSGEVVFDGRLMRGLGPAARCRLGIGRTYQVPRPFEQMTVFENVLVASQQGGGARRREAHDIAADVLHRTGLGPTANRPAGTLGLLQRKRLELARALATRPRLLLLDEIAGGLTDPEVAELMGIVQQAREAGVAVIWIEHVVRALVGTMDRLLCLTDGRFIGDGTPAEVLAMPSVREVFLGNADIEGEVTAPADGARREAGPLELEVGR